MSEYITWEELKKENPGLMDFEIAEWLFSISGIQPYTENGTPILCANKYNQKYIQKDKEFYLLQNEIRYLGKLKPRMLGAQNGIKQIKKIAKNATPTLDERRAYYRLHETIHSLKEKYEDLFLQSHSGGKVYRFKHPYDTDVERYKFDPPLLVELIRSEEPGEKYFYIFEFEIKTIESLWAKINDRLPEAYNNLDSIIEDMIAMESSGFLGDFELPQDDVLRGELINILKKAIYRSKDIAGIKKVYKEKSNTVKDKKRRGGAFTSKAIELGIRLLPEVQLAHEVIKKEFGFKDRGTPTQRRDYLKGYIEDNKNRFKVLYRRLHILKTDIFYKKQRNAVMKEKILCELVNDHGYHIKNYRGFWKEVKGRKKS